MKKMLIGMLMAVMMLTASIASAEVKELKVVPQLVGNIVHLGEVSTEAKIIGVFIYDDAGQRQPRQITPVTSATKVELLPGEGFNFQWSDASGTYWQLITPQSPTGSGISIDCGNGGGCKYFRRVIR